MAIYPEELPEPESPTPGSIPGLRRGMNVFVKWTTMLTQQAEVINNAWGKLRSGDFEIRDYFSTIGDLVDTTAAALQFSTESLLGPTAPPWATLEWPIGAEQQAVRVKLPVDRRHTLRTTPLSMLGGPDNAKLQCSVSVAEQGNAIDVRLEPADEEPKAGEYIGFVFSNHYADPLAILTLFVPELERPAKKPPAKRNSAARARAAGKKSEAASKARSKAKVKKAKARTKAKKK